MAAGTTRLFRAVLRDARPPLSIRLRRTFSEWVAGKGFAPINAGLPRDEQEVNGARLRVERRHDSGRFTLEEPCEDGTLRTTVTYTETVDDMPGWVVVEVEQVGGSEQVTANAPGFLPAYLDTARITDGAVHLEGGPVPVDEQEVPRFLQTLAERNRRVPVAVVSVDPKDPNAARCRAARIAEATAGAAIVAWFADMHAQNLFNRIVADELRVYGGAVRTYAAGFDPADRRTAGRHRVMSAQRLRSQGDQALQQLVDGIIGQTLWRELPDDVDRTLPVVHNLLLGRAEPRRLAEAVARRQDLDPAKQDLHRRMMEVVRAAAETRRQEPEPAPADDAASRPDAEEAASPAPEPPPAPAEAVPDAAAPGLAEAVAEHVVKELRPELDAALSLAAHEGARAARQVEILAIHLAGIRDLLASRLPGAGAPAQAGDGHGPLAERLERLQEEHDRLLAEHSEAIHTVSRLKARVRYLERRLLEAGRPEYGRGDEEDAFAPESIAAVLVAAKELPHVRLCEGVAEEAGRLDLLHPQWSRVWAARAWSALLALNDYARARSSGEFSGGFFDWCNEGCDDRFTIPTRMIAMRESQSVTTRAKFSSARTFRVPEEVDPSGRILMEAHIKLRPVGYPAPRMYFHDDTAGATGKIWIGYLGEHLPNTRTN